MSRRLDQELVDRGLAPSRTRARDLIEAGQVFKRENSKLFLLQKPSSPVSERDELVIVSGSADRYVSRGGLKLQGALEKERIDPQGWRVIDVGQSTGGFTDCLLQAGASQVVGFDVGHGQLHTSLKADPRVVSIEGLNIKDLATDPRGRAVLAEKVNLIVADLSFISLSIALPVLAQAVGKDVRLLALVKPQFEVGPEGLGKGGLVRDPLLYSVVESKMRGLSKQNGWNVLSYFESSIEGKDGNKEFFLHAIKE